jgi:hypothetical protein
MNFTYRLIYFIFGFSIGLIFLFFFFDRKNTSFNYLPSSRVKNNLLSKKINFGNYSKDSALIKNIIRNGQINFSNSKIGSDSCNIYFIGYKNKKSLQIQNCKDKAEILNLN